MTNQEQKELQQLRKEKEIAEAKRLETNRKSALWHRQKRVKNQFYQKFFESNGTKEARAELEQILAESN